MEQETPKVSLFYKYFSYNRMMNESAGYLITGEKKLSITSIDFVSTFLHKVSTVMGQLIEKAPV